MTHIWNIKRLLLPKRRKMWWNCKRSLFKNHRNCLLRTSTKGCLFRTFNIQLTLWILWNGKFYNRDVIKMTITRAKGKGNGHFYHIEVIDLPFHTIPFVSCFISLIDNTKKEILLKIYKQLWDNLCASKFTGQSMFSSAYYASFDAQPRAVRADNDNGRRVSSQDYASIARTQWWF